MLVASVIPAMPLPWAKAVLAAMRKAANKKIFFVIIINCFCAGGVDRPSGGLILFYFLDLVVCFSDRSSYP